MITELMRPVSFFAFAMLFFTDVIQFAVCDSQDTLEIWTVLAIIWCFNTQFQMKFTFSVMNEKRK